jgi:hypothetical protein
VKCPEAVLGVLAALSLAGCGERGPVLRDVPPQQVCATLGSPRRATERGWTVEAPKLRATIAGSAGHAAELELRYLGPSAESERLRSGLERRQLGLELAARDTCNLIYVMWRLEPAAELVVSIKQNPGQRRHAECKNNGYRNLRPSATAALPRLEPGSVHRLRAEIRGDELEVFADGQRVWRGPLDEPARTLSGRSGLRSDNVRFEVLSLRADVADSSPACDVEPEPTPS